MAVFGLMYHRTPDEPWHVLDTALERFKDHIRALRSAGYEFISATEAAGPKGKSAKTHIAVTFDDGHSSNLRALEFMRDEGLPVTSFIIRDFTLAPTDGFMDAAQVVQAGQCGEVGAHGATHTALSTLSPADLDAELHGSRDFLADLCGREITSMSAPGGAMNGRVLRAAVRAGFKTVAVSRAGPTRSATPLKRMCVLAHHTPDDILGIVQAGSLHWAKQEARMAVTGAAFRLLGEERYERIRMGLGGKPRPVRAHEAL